MTWRLKQQPGAKIKFSVRAENQSRQLLLYRSNAMHGLLPYIEAVCRTLGLSCSIYASACAKLSCRTGGFVAYAWKHCMSTICLLGGNSGIWSMVLLC